MLTKTSHSLLPAALTLLAFVAGCFGSASSDPPTANEETASTENSASTENVAAADDGAGNDVAGDVEAEAAEASVAPETQSARSAPSTPATGTKKPAAPQISGEAFRFAAYEGRLDTVRSAVEAGMDVNGIDPAQKLTALHMAAYNGHTETVKYLIAQGATVDCRDGEGKTPLIHACTGPFAESVRVLIAAGADVNARDATEGFTPLMMAAGLGEPEVVEVLLENKADASLVDQDQETAADHARNAGHDEIVKMLK